MTGLQIKSLRSLLASSILTAALTITGCGSDDQVSQDASMHIKRGETYLNQGQFKAAMIEARNALKKAPKEVESHVLMANIMLEIGQGKSALNQLEALKGNTSSSYLLTKAETLNSLRKFRSAEKLLNEHQLLLRQENTERYLELIGLTQLGLNNPTAARDAFTELLELSPSSALALTLLAQVEATTNNLEQAMSLLEQALATDRALTEALLLKASIHFKNNELAEAEGALTDALTGLDNADIVTPVRINILRSLAQVLTLQGRSSEALIYTKLLADAMPGQSELKIKFDEGLALFKEGKFQEAEALLQEVVDAAPGFETAGQILGLIKYSRGNLEGADQYFNSSIDPEVAPEIATTAFAVTSMRLNNPQKVLDLLKDTISDSTNVEHLGLYGLAALSAGQIEKGEATLLKALELDPKRSRLRLALAQIYNDSKNSHQALEQLRLSYRMSPEDPYIQKGLARQLLIMEDEEGLKKLMKDIEKKFQGNSSSLILLSSYKASQGEQELAIKTLHKALELKPKNIEARQILGALYLQTLQLEQAQDHYRDTIKELPNDPIGYKGLVTAYELQGDKSKGLEHLRELAENSPNPAPRLVLAEYHARKRNFELANAALFKLQQDFPNNLQVQQLGTQVAQAEGTFHLSQRNPEKAREVLMQGLQANPDSPSLQGLLARAEIDSQKFREASKLADQLAANNPNLAMLIRGDIAAAEDKTSIALNHYQTLWENAPSDAAANRIYQLYSQQNNQSEKLAFLEKWAKQLPNSAAMMLTRSSDNLSNQQFSAAITDLEKLNTLQQQRPSAITLNNLAWSYLQLGKLSKALKYAEQAYTLAPESAAVADTYGWILYKSDNTAEAVKILTLANKLAPENPEIQAHLDVVRGGS